MSVIIDSISGVCPVCDAPASIVIPHTSVSVCQKCADEGVGVFVGTVLALWRTGMEKPECEVDWL